MTAKLRAVLSAIAQTNARNVEKASTFQIMCAQIAILRKCAVCAIIVVSVYNVTQGIDWSIGLVRLALI